MTRAGEKMLTTVLAATCGVLFVLALAMQFGLGRGYHWLEADKDSTDTSGNAAIDRDPIQLPPLSNFAATDQRPLFNDDRKPSKEEDAGATVEGPPPTPLNISLTGTLLVGKPTTRTAMVRENGKAQTIALKEGMPLPGDQGAWTLSQVKNRSAVFKNGSGEEVEVELAVASASQKPTPPPRVGGAAGAAAPNHAVNPAQAGPVPAQGDELQRRIEERRKQMREAAERMKAERQNDQQTPQPPQPAQPQQQ
jgi:general secretion pathway protein N